MAAPPVKSQAQPLHNFPLTTFLKWNSANNSNQRFRRTTTSSESPPTPPEVNGERSDSERAGSRSRRNHSNRLLLGQLDKPHKQSADPEENVATKNDDESEEAEPEEMVQKPWNLRSRRGVNPTPKNGERYEVDVMVHPSENQQPKSKRSRRGAEISTANGGLKKEKKRRFWISLSKEEIEEDVYSLTGSRPSRRPKKWPKIVQKKLDNVFPGLWLAGMSADSYRPPDTQAKK